MRGEKDIAKEEEFSITDINKARVNVHHPFLFALDHID